MTVNISVKDALQTLRKKLVVSESEVDAIVEDILVAMGTRLHELIVQMSPVNEGKYAGSWKLQTPDSRSIKITNPDGLKYTILEFTGTRPHKIEPKNSQFLHFVINGKDIYVKSVNHPGTQPDPHVRPALEQLGRDVAKIVDKAITKKFPFFK